MSIVVTTPTGNIGSVLVQQLLDRGKKPVLIARNPEKVENFTSRGAAVREGSHSDPAFLAEATRGAEALFWLTPPNLAVDDVRAYYRDFAEAAVRAIRENEIPRVVHLSSVGGEVESGTGPIAALHAVEEALDSTGASVTHLRPCYFMENTLAQIPSIQNANSLFTTFPEGFRLPMIATRDIGARAAAVLADQDWTGRRVMELQGPGDCGYEEVAETLSRVLGREIKHVPIGGGQFVEAAMGMGISKAVAESFVEMVNAIVEGKVRLHEPRNEKNTTPTTYREFAETVFKPAFQAAG